MCLDACNKNSKYFIVWKKSITTHWKVCQKRAAPRWVNLVVRWLHQGFKFFLSLSSAICHGLTLFSRQFSFWISSVLPETWQISREEDVWLYPVFIFRELKRGRVRHFSQKPPKFSMSLLTRLAHVLILRLSTDRQEIITASQRSHMEGCWTNYMLRSKKGWAEYLLSGHNIYHEAEKDNGKQASNNVTWQSDF